MTIVHEQCPNSDSEIVLSQKLVKCTMCTHTAQLARPGARRHAQAPAQWPCRGRPAGRVAGPRSPLRAVSRAMPRACAPRAARLCPAPPRYVVALYCDTKLYLLLPMSQYTRCIAIQNPCCQPFLVIIH